MNLFKWFSKSNNTVDKEFIADGDFFYKEFDNIRIYTHDIECIKRAFRHIFDRHIYDFKTNSETPLIIDAGANIGLGVLYWKLKFPNAKIIAFEPSRQAYKSLLKNVEYNNLKDVVCINKALSNTVGIQQFTTNEIISGSLIVEKNLETNYEVETTLLGEYLKQPIEFLKIDIEGAERYIFDDIKNNIQNVQNIFLEYHSFITEKQYLSDYLNLFEKNDLRYFIEDEYKKTHHLVEKKISLNQDMQLNIWASRN